MTAEYKSKNVGDYYSEATKSILVKTSAHTISVQVRIQVKQFLNLENKKVSRTMRSYLQINK